MDYEPCPICKSPARISGMQIKKEVNCFRCGQYTLCNMVDTYFSMRFPANESRLLFSSYLFENPGMVIFPQNLLTFENIRQPSISERAHKVLSALAKQVVGPGSYLKIVHAEIQNAITIAGLSASEWNRDSGFIFDAQKYFPLLSAAWTQRAEELLFYIKDYLMDSLGYVKELRGQYYTLSPRGWEYLSQGAGSKTTKDVFVAMSFDSQLLKFYKEVIAEAIIEAGYNPIRVDFRDHLNRIDDEIIASIRRAKFIVADFTQQKGGVYFEAGFALGLGLKVIWMCKLTEEEMIHFDTRQFNTIFWTEDKQGEAKRRLRDRIEANFGHGNQMI